MKNSKVKLVAIILATTMASVFFTGCSQANERNEESSNENIVVSLVSEEDLEESSEEETSVEESVVESEVESSVESEVVSAESSVESEVVSVESSVEESETKNLALDTSKLYTYHLFKKEDIVSYGKINATVTITSPTNDISIKFPEGAYVSFLGELGSDCIVIYYNTMAVPIYLTCVQIFDSTEVPDFSDTNWVGMDE